jgi:hypothetical protein
MSFIGGKQSPSSEFESDVSLVTESRKRRQSAILQEAMENAVSFPAAPENIAKETNSLLENQELKRKKRAKESKPRAMPQWLPDEVRFLCRRFFSTCHYVPCRLSVYRLKYLF